MTPGIEPALTPEEWLSGTNRGKNTHSTTWWLGRFACPCTVELDSGHVAHHPGFPEMATADIKTLILKLVNILTSKEKSEKLLEIFWFFSYLNFYFK